MVIAVGALFVGSYLAAVIDARVTSHAVESSFEAFRGLRLENGSDQALWSPGQRGCYRETNSSGRVVPPAMLRIPSSDPSVPVYGSATDLNSVSRPIQPS